MRVSNQMLFQQTQTSIQRAAQRVAQLQEAVSSGKRINHFTDDPINAVRALDLREMESSLDQYGKNIDSGLPFLKENDSVLGDVVDALGRAKELALQMANGSNNAQDRAAAATELQQIYERVVSLANTQLEGRYIFGGFKNDAAPFSSTGAYLGDNGQINIQATASSSLTLNVPGNQVFQGAGVNGGVGLLDALRDLKAVMLS